MKKITKISFASLAFTTMLFATGCGGDNPGPVGPGPVDNVKLEFSLAFSEGTSVLHTGEAHQVDLLLENDISYDPNFKFQLENAQYTYTNTKGEDMAYNIKATDYVTLTTTGEGKNKRPVLTPKKATRTTIVDPSDNQEYTFNQPLTLKVQGTYMDGEFEQNVTHRISFSCSDSVIVEGGYNYSTAKYTAEDRSTEVLGLLEKYAMDNHLTGISLFENSGYIRYSDRVKSPNGFKYITNYGFGILSEGEIVGELAGEQGAHKPSYYHSQSASNPDTINALDNQGSEVSSLYDYISSSYYAMKLNDENNAAVWYPVLASNIERQKDGPIASDLDGHETGAATSTTWKIYVKCKENKTLENPRDDKLTYSTASAARSAFNGREVSIDDYIYAYKLLLTGSHNYFRGSEAAGDTSNGIVGAAAYYARTKNTSGVDDATFNDLVHVKKGHDADGYFITIETLNPMDQFTAMYSLSSNLYCPVPADFLDAIGGPKYYGKNNGTQFTPADNILSLAPYTLETWEDLNIDFKRNASWTEFQFANDVNNPSHVPGTTNRYKIDGVAIRINKNAASDQNEVYKQLTQYNNVDAASIPQAYLDTDKNYGHRTEGSSVFKLNVNSCTQEEWNALFGPEGSNSKHVKNESEIYNCKPWMSNDNFIDGLNLSIDRDTFAEKRGATGSNAYFSNNYMSDAKNGISYNETSAHKEAMKAYYPETKGYSIAAAQAKFKKAVKELVASGDIKYGTATNPTVLDVDIWWMYESDKTDYGIEIANYFEGAFNDPSVCDGKVKLHINQNAVTTWDKVYDEHLQVGKFDLGFGAISGNAYDPLNFLEVLKSDDSSGFTLNWGTDTSKADPSLEFDGKYWSFDALWTAADHGGIFAKGTTVTTAKGFIKSVTPANGTAGNLIEGGDIKIEFAFADIKDLTEDELRGVKFEVSNVQIFPFGSANMTFSGSQISVERVGNTGVVTVHITKAQAEELEELIRTGLKIKDTEKDACFQMMYYGSYWAIEFHYTMQIGKTGTPSNGYFYASRTEADMKEDFKLAAVR